MLSKRIATLFNLIDWQIDCEQYIAVSINKWLQDASSTKAFSVVYKTIMKTKLQML